MEETYNWSYNLDYHEQPKASQQEVLAETRKARKILNEIASSYSPVKHHVIRLIQVLLQHPDKEYIYWPNRKQALSREFIEALNGFVEIDKILVDNKASPYFSGEDEVLLKLREILQNES